MTVRYAALLVVPLAVAVGSCCVHASRERAIQAPSQAARVLPCTDTRPTSALVPADLGRSVVLPPMTRFCVARLSGASSPRELLGHAAQSSGFPVRDDPDSKDALLLTARSDRGDLDVSVTWAACGSAWVVRVDGGIDREELSSAVMRRLRRVLSTMGAASSDGGIDEVWAAGIEDGQLTFHYLWPDCSWMDAIDGACAERGWVAEQRDVLQEAYEFIVVDRNHRDIGLINVELYGRIRCSFSGSACGTEQDFIERLLHHWSLVPETQPSCQSMTRGLQPRLP